MKTNNSIKNSITIFISNALALLIGFISQKIFINILGLEYLGLNGLFTNIISMLGIVELGIGNAIIYNLYKPIVQNDKETIKSLMKFYRKSYILVAIIVLLISLLLIPFLGFFVDLKSVTIDINITFIYMLFILDIVSSYLFSYKRSILYADEKNYIINYIHIGYLLVLNITQLLILFITKNYYLYLIIKIIVRIIENIVITKVANKKYSYLLDKDIRSLDKEILNDIIKKIKALFFHKIGSFIVLGTDNILISKFFGLISVGLYSNYYLIINAMQTLFSQVINALTPSIGHLLVEEDYNKNYAVFKKINFINFWITTFSGICILNLIDPFITLWIGEKYLLGFDVLIVLVLNYYQRMMRYSYSVFKEAAGIYYEDRFVPLIESVLNIIFSIILLKIFGLKGVFIGTLVSSLALWGFSYPKYVYKKLFNQNMKSYIFENIKYLIIFILLVILSIIKVFIFKFDSAFITLFVNLIISIIIPNLIIILIFHKNEEFKYFIKLICKKLGVKNEK